jgi:DnaB-helicase binding domain of primase
LKKNLTCECWRCPSYRKLLAQAPPYLDYLIGRARQMDRSTAAGKVAALNYLMPFVQRLPDRLLRSEWATRIASELRVDEPVLREALRRAATERRSEVKPKVELLSPLVKPAERQLIRMLIEAEGFREKLAGEIIAGALHRGLESEKVLELLVSKVGERPDPATLAPALEERDRRLLFEVMFETSGEATWEAAESCLSVLRGRRDEQELAELQKKIEAKVSPEELNRLLTLRLDLQKKLARR